MYTQEDDLPSPPPNYYPDLDAEMRALHKLCDDICHDNDDARIYAMEVAKLNKSFRNEVSARFEMAALVHKQVVDNYEVMFQILNAKIANLEAKLEAQEEKFIPYDHPFNLATAGSEYVSTVARFTK